MTVRDILSVLAGCIIIYNRDTDIEYLLWEEETPQYLLDMKVFSVQAEITENGVPISVIECIN